MQISSSVGGLGAKLEAKKYQIACFPGNLCTRLAQPQHWHSWRSLLKATIGLARLKTMTTNKRPCLLAWQKTKIKKEQYLFRWP